MDKVSLYALHDTADGRASRDERRKLAPSATMQPDLQVLTAILVTGLADRLLSPAPAPFQLPTTSIPLRVQSRRMRRIDCHLHIILLNCQPRRGYLHVYEVAPHVFALRKPLRHIHHAAPFVIKALL